MSGYQKRISSPRAWPIGRKEHKWIVKPIPGTHSIERSIPLLVLLRDMLGVVDNGHEAKYALRKGRVLVDGIVRKAYRFPVGLFDLISILPDEKHYRVLLSHRGKITVRETDEPKVKLCKIEKKQVVRGGKIQIGLHDGTNILTNNDYRRKDSIMISIPEREILKHIKYEAGRVALVTGGKHTGEVGKIKKIEVREGSNPNIVTIEMDDKIFETIEDYAFIVGEEKPLLNLEI